jgi:hypothetical protein
MDSLYEARERNGESSMSSGLFGKVERNDGAAHANFIEIRYYPIQ